MMIRTSPKFSAIVLAGQRPGPDPVAEARGVRSKALAPVGGRAMILNVLDALEASPWIGDIYVTMEDPDLADTEPRLTAFRENGHIVEGDGSICANVRRAAAEKNVKTPLLVVTADHALLTPEMVDHFCRETQTPPPSRNEDFLFAVVAERAFRRIYPAVRRTFLRFRDDNYSGCNMYAFMTPASFRVLDFWEKVEQQRKHPLRLIRALGPLNLLRYLLRLEQLAGMVGRAGHLLGLNGRAVVMPQAEAAIDVDTPRDLALVEEILGARDPARQTAKAVP